MNHIKLGADQSFLKGAIDDVIIPKISEFY